MKTLYFDCFSGISGDMALAALTDLGVPVEYLEKMLESLGLEGWKLRFSRVKKQGIDACYAHVILQGDDHHDHDGHHDDHHDHEHDHGHNHDHHHDHDHDNPNPHSHQTQRGLTEIIDIIGRSGITAGAKGIAEKAFRLLAQAEARAHGCPIEQVHFHEAGATDSIVDIVGAAVCIDYLSPDRVLCSPLREGRGQIECRHGIMPVPAPATAELIRMMGAPLQLTDISGEMITPTGASLLAAVCDGFGAELPPLRIKGIGLGAGAKDFPHANILRVMLLEQHENISSDRVTVIETNIDDSTPEALGYTMERLLEAGARDVFYTPVYMKKGRPASLLTVLCDEAERDKIIELIFRETGSIGLRFRETERRILDRKTVSFQSSLGEASIKLAGGRPRVEFDAASKLARENNLPLCEVYDLILQEYRDQNLNFNR